MPEHVVVDGPDRPHTSRRPADDRTQLVAKATAHALRERPTLAEQGRRARQPFRDQRLRRGIRVRCAEVVDRHAVAREVVEGEVDPIARAQVVADVLQVIEELQRRADPVGEQIELRVVVTEDAQHEATDRIRRAPAIVEELLGVGITRDPQVLREGVEQIEEEALRKAEFGDGRSQVDEERHVGGHPTLVGEEGTTVARERRGIPELVGEVVGDARERVDAVHVPAQPLRDEERADREVLVMGGRQLAEVGGGHRREVSRHRRVCGIRNGATDIRAHLSGRGSSGKATASCASKATMSHEGPGIRPSTWWIWSLGLLVLVALAIAGLGSWATARFEAVRAAVQRDLAARLAVIAPTRPGVFGAVVDGETWTDWLPAIAALDKTALDGLGPWLDNEPSAVALRAEELARLDAAIAAHEAPLRALCSGALRATGRFPAEPARVKAILDDVFRPLLLANLATVAADRRAAQGDLPGAVELALAAAQFGRDLADDGPTLAAAVGASAVRRATRVLARLALAAQLEGELLARVEAAARVLDESWPSSAATLAAEHEFMLREIVLGDALGGPAYADLGFGIPTLSFWKHGFSPKAAVASFWELTPRLQAGAAHAATLPWDAAVAEYRVLAAMADTTPLRMLVADPSHADRASREGRATVRLLREALTLARGRELEGLHDPFTLAPFAKSQLNGVLRVRSVGGDGIDSGGVGWLVPPIDGDDYAFEFRLSR